MTGIRALAVALHHESNFISVSVIADIQLHLMEDTE